MIENFTQKYLLKSNFAVLFVQVYKRMSEMWFLWSKHLLKNTFFKSNFAVLFVQMLGILDQSSDSDGCGGELSKFCPAPRLEFLIKINRKWSKNLNNSETFYGKQCDHRKTDADFLTEMNGKTDCKTWRERFWGDHKKHDPTFVNHTKRRCLEDIDIFSYLLKTSSAAAPFL